MVNEAEREEMRFQAFSADRIVTLLGDFTGKKGARAVTENQ